MSDPTKKTRMSKNLTYSKAYDFALEVFGYDRDKTNMFWMTKAEAFGASRLMS